RFAAEDVRRFLGHRLPGVRCAALKAVARWRDADAIAAVRDLAAGDPSAFVRPCAVAALGELLGADPPAALAELVDDANALVRAAVVGALAGLRPLPADARPLLERLAADEAAAVARRAGEALQAAGDGTTPKGEEAPAGAAQLPPALRPHAAAARAFLAAWRL